MKNNTSPDLLPGGEIMPATSTKGEEKRLRLANASNDIIGWILQGGVILSAALIIIGLLLLPTRPGGLSTERLLNFPQTLYAVRIGLFQLQPQAIISLGLLVLIATPVVRVAASTVTFILEHDRKFVIITLIVLVILLFSIFYLSANAIGQRPSGTNSIHYSLLTASLIFLASIIAGLLGSLVGLGGGVLVVPLLTLVFHFPIEYAIGASIISVIATSSGAAAAYVRDRMTNMHVGMFLELGTTLGAITGAFIAAYLSASAISIIFGVILIISLLPSFFKLSEEHPQNVKNDRISQWLHLNSSYPDKRLGREISYNVSHTTGGLMMMFVAGATSGLLGIGSGTFKVLALDTIMRLPLKVSTTTSNFMIGVTAAASAGIYFARCDIPPLAAAPVALGILVGARAGIHIFAKIGNQSLRIIFLVVITFSAIEMILRGLGVNGF